MKFQPVFDDIYIEGNSMASDISSTTDISWIRLAITARYPNIVKDKGADLKNNGKIEGNEVFGDLDGSGTIDDKDFWMYLERNKPVIAKQIEFIGCKNKNISDDNIINHLMFVESQMCKKEDVQEAYDKIDEILTKASIKTHKEKYLNEVLASVYDLLKNDLSFTFKDSAGPLLINSLLKGKGELNCTTYIFLLLAMGHEFKWPLYAVPVPGHIFIRWDDGGNIFNFDDKGDFPPNEYYKKWCNINDKTIKNGIYLRSLNQKETIGLFYDNRGRANLKLGKYENAINDFTIMIDIYPKPDAYCNRGVAKDALSKHKEAVEDYTEANRLDPNCSAASNNLRLDTNYSADYYNRGLTEFKSWHFIAVFKDFWKYFK